MAQGEGGGRPLKFGSVKKLREAIEAYFESCFEFARDGFGNRIVERDEDGKIVVDAEGKKVYVRKKVKAFTVTGLALALGTTRKTLMEYDEGKYDGTKLTDEQKKVNKQIDTFSNTIKAAKLRCYEDTEQYLYRVGTARGAIFSLKNNYGWVDKTVTENENAPFVNPYAGLSESELKRLAEDEDE
jgi:hypothetical protein